MRGLARPKLVLTLHVLATVGVFGAGCAAAFDAAPERYAASSSLR